MTKIFSMVFDPSRCLATVLAVTAMVTLFPITQGQLPAEGQAEVNTLRAENQALRERVAELEAQLAQLQAELRAQRQLVEDAPRAASTIPGATEPGQEPTPAASRERDDRVIQRALGRFTTAVNSDGLTQHTSASSRMRFIRGGGRRHLVSVIVVEPDDASTDSVASRLVHVFIQTSQTGGDYDRRTTMTLETGGERIELQPASYRKVGANRRANETLRFTLTPDQARSLANAPTVTGTLGHRTFELTVEQQDALAGAVALMSNHD